LAGELLLGEGREGDRPGDHRRRERSCARTVDRLPGRLDDGAWLPGRVRRARKRALRVDTSVPAVLRSLLRLAPPLRAAAPRPARVALVLGLARVLQPRTHLRLGAAHLPAAALPARADARAAAPAAGGPRGARANDRLTGDGPATGPRELSTAAAPADPRSVAGNRHRLAARLPDRAQRDRRERDRRRLRGRDRRQQGCPRRCSLWSLAGRQRTRRHVWSGQLRGVRSVRADLRLERHLGRPARRARRVGLLRPARGRPAVPDRPAHARPDARHRARLRVGLLSLHAVRARERLQRHACRGDDSRGALLCRLAACAARLRRSRD